MSHVPHELTEVFADRLDDLHKLKASPHFARLEEDYHALNRDIHRAEADIEPISEAALEDMKKRRLKLLDEIRGMMAAA